ncbi:UPF0149 family protein [Desulfopila aestuarii]|uniref:YecA family protein n=1 Tax=Desulfopila aestuarii DSM 18488 TaxID=1121416 RepID=A0A1M7YGD0_9BACT|nr:UPF0149 family protein [Desulfopila aestuarii]SHO51704.1 yecA family protein [Desulfopila aestuarii DSM 18488]
MLSPTEKTLLQELLARAPIPEQTMSYNELMGFMFGLAITPVAIPPDEWMVAIFGEDDSEITAMDQARSMSIVLSQVFATFIAKKERDDLPFPYELETLEHCDLEEVLEWVSGFEEALGLRPEIWEPGDDSSLAPQMVEELYFSLMVIQGLVDPEEIMPFFEQLPDEVFAQAFSHFDPDQQNRELQIDAFLLSTLPLAVKTLRSYAEAIGADMPAGTQPDISAALKPPVFPAPTPPAAKSARKANVIKVDFGSGKKKPKAKAEHLAYQFKISLQGAKPPIWRRVLVPDTVTLADLHEIIQLTMGWFDSHLHQFQIGRKAYGPELDDDWGMEPIANEEEYTLHNLAKDLAPHFSYTYDFGDDWEHRITVEKTLPINEGKPYPVLIKGKRACPPEDCGGIWGYMEFLEAYSDPEHEEHASMQEWAGPDFQPERFDQDEIDEINEALKDMFD